MYRPHTSIAFFAYAVALAVAQSAVTIYDISFVPEPTNSGTGNLEAQIKQFNGPGGLFLGGGDIRASAVAVDAAGATYYVGVQQVSVVATEIDMLLTTFTLPTPTPTTCKFSIR
jgi:hypothetical protein